MIDPATRETTPDLAERNYGSRAEIWDLFFPCRSVAPDDQGRPTAGADGLRAVPRGRPVQHDLADGVRVHVNRRRLGLGVEELEPRAREVRARLEADVRRQRVFVLVLLGCDREAHRVGDGVPEQHCVPRCEPVQAEAP